MIIYRIVSEPKYAVLDGKGAAQSNINRWNSPGYRVVYTSESIELAMAESGGLISIGLLPDPQLIEIEIDDSLTFREIAFAQLTDDWSKHPPGNETKQIGDDFLKNQEHLAMLVPSRRGEAFNILINPIHPDFEKKVKIKSIKPLRS